LKKPLASDPHAGIDLHVHSTASDGTLTPPEILEMAVQLGLKAVSITDHDTLSGSAAALPTEFPGPLNFLPESKSARGTRRVSIRKQRSCSRIRV
jgi:predicted metal-dependent phosphoesterase TrpH